jgi:hypothetical protein
MSRGMDSEELKGVLNHCLNDAFTGKHRIRGIPSSNNIAGFIIEWMERERTELVPIIGDFEQIILDKDLSESLDKLTQKDKYKAPTKKRF